MMFHEFPHKIRTTTSYLALKNNRLQLQDYTAKYSWLMHDNMAKSISTTLPSPSKGTFASNTWTSCPLPSVDTTRVSGRRLPLLPELTAVDWQLPPVELKGQVTLQTTFGQELNRLARLPQVHLVLEIGTWFGGGSSWCIAQGLRSTLLNPARPDKWLLTLEMFDEAWRYASQTLQRLPATCMKAGTVYLDAYLKPEQMTQEDRASEHYQLYYERDIGLAREATPLLEKLCSTYDFDLVLIDGNEYTGLAEYEIVDRVCRPRYLALHDTGTLKTRRAEELLAGRTTDWRKISSGTDAAEWAVFENQRWGEGTAGATDYSESSLQSEQRSWVGMYLEGQLGNQMFTAASSYGIAKSRVSSRCYHANISLIIS